jgi:hypothetical protein
MLLGWQGSLPSSSFKIKTTSILHGGLYSEETSSFRWAEASSFQVICLADP